MINKKAKLVYCWHWKVDNDKNKINKKLFTYEWSVKCFGDLSEYKEQFITTNAVKKQNKTEGFQGDQKFQEGVTRQRAC